MRFLALIALASLVAVPAFAEDVVYRKHVVVDFEDEVIESVFPKPEGTVCMSTKAPRHAPFFRPREQFRLEVLKGALGF